MNDTDRAELWEATHQCVHDVFLDVPEGVDSRTMATNVMRWIEPIIERVEQESYERGMNNGRRRLQDLHGVVLALRETSDGLIRQMQKDIDTLEATDG